MRQHRTHADAGSDDDGAKPAHDLVRHRIENPRHHVRHDTDGRQLAASNQGAAPRRLPIKRVSARAISRLRLDLKGGSDCFLRTVKQQLDLSGFTILNQLEKLLGSPIKRGQGLEGIESGLQKKLQ